MLSTVEKTLFLKSIDLFSEIPAEALSEIAQVTREEFRDAGNEIFAEGEPGDALYLVLEGRVRVHRESRLIAELGERECFGEMAILDVAPRSATVTAMTDLRLLRIHRSDFQEVMMEKPEVSRGVVRILTRRLRNAIG